MSGPRLAGGEDWAAPTFRQSYGELETIRIKGGNRQQIHTGDWGEPNTLSLQVLLFPRDQ